MNGFVISFRCCDWYAVDVRHHAGIVCSAEMMMELPPITAELTPTRRERRERSIDLFNYNTDFISSLSSDNQPSTIYTHSLDSYTTT